MSDEVVADGPTLALERGEGVLKVSGVPKDDGGDEQVEAGGTVDLVLEGAIAQFPETAEEHGAGERVTRLPLC